MSHCLSSCPLRWAMVAAAVCFFSAPVLAEDKDASLPLSKVVLFNSGVGFFQHDAEIEGQKKIELKFNVNDINDLLKSMILQDLGGGRIATVTYASREPITKTLKTFSLDLTDNPTLADLLQQARGEKVEVDAPNKIAGTIVSIERRKEQVGSNHDIVEKEYVNLLTDEGLRSLPLASVARIKLVNEKLDAELRQALTLLALGHATDKKTVTLDFLGQGKRPVRVGYVQEAPIWKTSYRLVLSDKEPPFLQGWAIVENTTEHDWSDIQLTLVSGRPISFVMNLYDPLYVPRPVVEPELFASLRPQTYGQDLGRKEVEFAGRDKDGTPALAATGAVPQRRMAANAYPAAAAERQGQQLPLREINKGVTYYGLDQGVSSVAQAGDVGELFQYVIDTPVTLPRQQSAMLPIVQGSVKGEKVSIYNPSVQPKHPLNGLRLTNTTAAHLMQGPITVFDGGSYAGDSRIEDLSPGGERLLSYALDLDTEVAMETTAKPEELVRVRLYKGTVTTSRKYERSVQYTVKNSGDKSKHVLIEYPYDSSWKLIAPAKPAEKTRNMYRFALDAAPGKPAKLNVDEEQVLQQQIGLDNLDDRSIRIYFSSKVVSDAVKAALSEVVRQKQALEKLAVQRKQLDAQLNTITQEQTRIRQNMEQLDRNSDLYRQYVKKLTDQESQIDKLRSQSQATEQETNQARRTLDDYLRGLDVS